MRTSVLPPCFSSAPIQERTDGYFIITFQHSPTDRVPGLVVSGLNSGTIQFLDNPKNKKYGNYDNDAEWEVHDLYTFSDPVAVIAADVTGDGSMDLIVTHQYGTTMKDCDMKGGWVSWLENPGRDSLREGEKKGWVKRDIGRWPAAHRLCAGLFTQRSFLEIIAAPLVRGAHDKISPVPIICFQAPEKVREAIEWRRNVVDDEHFSVIHEIVAKKFDGPDGLHSLLIASREEISRPECEDEAKDGNEAENLPQESWIHVAQEALLEHGSIWHRDASGNALRGRNNVVSYPWHKWQGGNGGEDIDVWMAIEFNPDLAL